MLRWLTDSKRTNATALQLYGSSVAQARLAAFYRNGCVADSLEGRFELVSLHVGLLLRRLTAEGTEGKALGRAVVERMFAALDDDMRELGVGDLSVPKRMQAAAGSFYGRLRAYDAALQQGDDAALVQALQRNIPAAEGKVLESGRLATYVRRCAQDLAVQPFPGLRQGTVRFVEPVGLRS